jgi:hypothetical protein
VSADESKCHGQQPYIFVSFNATSGGDRTTKETVRHNKASDFIALKFEYPSVLLWV